MVPCALNLKGQIVGQIEPHWYFFENSSLRIALLKHIRLCNKLVNEGGPNSSKYWVYEYPLCINFPPPLCHHLVFLIYFIKCIALPTILSYPLHCPPTGDVHVQLFCATFQRKMITKRILFHAIFFVIFSYSLNKGKPQFRSLAEIFHAYSQAVPITIVLLNNFSIHLIEKSTKK